MTTTTELERILTNKLGYHEGTKTGFSLRTGCKFFVAFLHAIFRYVQKYIYNAPI
jgi:hypothetical protein